MQAIRIDCINWILAAVLLLPAVHAQDCLNTSVGTVPLTDLASGTYQGFVGGLYPGGSNQRPAAHAADGLAQAVQVVPRDAQGAVDLANGSVVLLSIGMSNTVLEFNAFLDLAAGTSGLDPRLVIVNGAQGGQAAEDIDDPLAPYWQGVDQKLVGAGVSADQVQVIWMLQANRSPSAPFPAHAQGLQAQYTTILQIVRDRFPNARLAYLASRIYAGYATTPLNPEPFAYEQGFTVKWLIEAQLAGDPALNFDADRGTVEAPWLSFGTYNWADGLVPRSDGLVWECADFNPDGTHPSPQGAARVAQMLLAFLQTDETATPWFLGGGGGGDVGTALCFGDGSGSPCPCGNESGLVGAGCEHSAGVGMTLRGSGSGSVAADDLTLIAESCPPTNSGIFFVGRVSLAPGNPFFDGLFCVSGNVRRFPGVVQFDGSVEDTGFVQHTGPYFQPGESYFFQYWSRDVSQGTSPCGNLANFSPAYRVVMTP